MNVLTKARFSLPVAAMCSFLAACATTSEPRIVTREVRVPVVQPCVPADKDPGPAKAYADANLPTAADAIAERFRFIAAANEQRKARLAVLEPILAACR